MYSSNQNGDLVEQYRVRVLILQLCYVPQYVFLCDDAQQTAVQKENKTTTHCEHPTIMINFNQNKSVFCTESAFSYWPINLSQIHNARKLLNSN